MLARVLARGAYCTTYYHTGSATRVAAGRGRRLLVGLESAQKAVRSENVERLWNVSLYRHPNMHQPADEVQNVTFTPVSRAPLAR